MGEENDMCEQILRDDNNINKEVFAEVFASMYKEEFADLKKALGGVNASTFIREKVEMDESTLEKLYDKLAERDRVVTAESVTGSDSRQMAHVRSFIVCLRLLNIFRLREKSVAFSTIAVA